MRAPADDVHPVERLVAHRPHRALAQLVAALDHAPDVVRHGAPRSWGGAAWSRPVAARTAGRRDGGLSDSGDEVLAARVLLERVGVERDAEAGRVGIASMPSRRVSRVGDQVVDVGGAGDVLDQVGVGQRPRRGAGRPPGRRRCSSRAGSSWMPWSSAIQPIRRCSLRPPTLVTSGWTMSNAPASSQGVKRLPPGEHLAAGDRHRRAARRSATKSSSASGRSASSNQATS